jgi:hypothetical protein
VSDLKIEGVESPFCKPVRKKTESCKPVPKAAGNIAPKIQKLSSHAGKMALDKPNIALKIKKPPHRGNAHLPLVLYVEAQKNSSSSTLG